MKYHASSEKFVVYLPIFAFFYAINVFSSLIAWAISSLM